MIYNIYGSSAPTSTSENPLDISPYGRLSRIYDLMDDLRIGTTQLGYDILDALHEHGEGNSQPPAEIENLIEASLPLIRKALAEARRTPSEGSLPVFVGQR